MSMIVEKLECQAFSVQFALKNVRLQSAQHTNVSNKLGIGHRQLLTRHIT